MGCLFQAGKCWIKSFLWEKKVLICILCIEKLQELLLCLRIKVNDERNMHTILLFFSVFQKKHGFVTVSALWNNPRLACYQNRRKIQLCYIALVLSIMSVETKHFGLIIAVFVSNLLQIIWNLTIGLNLSTEYMPVQLVGGSWEMQELVTWGFHRNK